MSQAVQKTEYDSADVKRLMELLPHRAPMLMIDRLEAIIPGVSATGIKCVSINEPFFAGHFPGHPVLPGETGRTVAARDGRHCAFSQRKAENECLRRWKKLSWKAPM